MRRHVKWLRAATVIAVVAALYTGHVLMCDVRIDPLPISLAMSGSVLIAGGVLMRLDDLE